MQFEERDLAMSQHSDDSYTSSKWTHCTFMLRDDKADLCVSEFWTNLDRMKFALPTSPVVLTSYKLATQTVAVDEKKLSIEVRMDACIMARSLEAYEVGLQGAFCRHESGSKKQCWQAGNQTVLANRC